MKHNKTTMPPKEERELMNLKAANLEMESKLDLISMMTGVDFPEDEEAENDY